MALPPTLYEAVLLVAVVVTAGFAGYAWRRRSEPGGRFVLIYAGAAVAWSTGELVMALSAPFALKAAWFTILFVGVIVSIPAWFLFVLVYTGRWGVLDRRTVALVSALPAAAVLLAVTNPLHGLLFESLFLIPTGAGLDIAPAPAFFVWAVYSATLLLASEVLLLDTATRVPAYYRRQIGLLAVGAIAPPLGATFRMVGLTAVDLTAAGLVVSGLALSVAISREGFLDVSPVAGDVVVDTMDAGVFVVDRRGRLVDANAEARSMLGAGSGPDGPAMDVVGRHLDEVLADYPVALARYHEIVEAGITEAELDMPGGVYDVTVSPLLDHRDRLLGRVILVSDVTERKRRERELRRQNERLEEFASVLSHDIRNPLTIADLHLELARESPGEEHFEAIERSLGRMEDIVDDVLALAREGRTVTESDRQAVSVGEVARRAWAGTPTGNASLEVDADGEIQADPKRLQRAFENLVRNSVEHGSTGSRSRAHENSVEHGSTGSRPGADDAVEHGVGSHGHPADGEPGDDGPWATAGGGELARGPPAGESADVSGLTVRVGVLRPDGPEQDADGDPTGFYLEDDGRGIPPDEREAVLESGYSSSADGTGFGLAIVESVVEAHGWELSIGESDTGGARFEVTGVEFAD